MKTILTIVIALSSFAAIAQTDTNKVLTWFTSSDSLTTFSGSAFPIPNPFFTSSGGGMWVKTRTILVTCSNREEWSIGPIDKNGNATLYMKRSMLHWINDSTAYISTRIRKLKKHALAYYKKHAY